MTAQPPPESRDWTTLSRKVVYAGRPWLEVRQDEVRLRSGRTIPDFHGIWLPDYVIMLSLLQNPG